MEKQNILIVSYFFPPCNKVGGRRWAKFGKVLCALGYKVFVLAVDIPVKGVCPWEADIEAYKQNIVRIPYIEHRPYYQVNKSPETLTGKIRYRISWYYEKFFDSGKEKMIDISSRYGSNIRKEAKKIILENQITAVIVTGGPFHWCYEALQLKKDFPKLRFLLDLRDFWTSGEIYKELNEQQKKEEDRKEQFCISLADYVFTPAERIAQFLKDKYKSEAHKIITLTHAYDEDETPRAIEKTISSDGRITFAYGGILYSNMQDSITNLISLLKGLMASGMKVELNIYTFDNNYKNMFEAAGLSHCVHYHETVSPKKLFELFLRTDYLLQLRAGETQEQHFKSTKFYELIALRKPIIYFGPAGDVSEFLVQNKLGFSGNTYVEPLVEMVLNNKRDNTIPDMSFDIADYEFKHVTKELETYLK